MEKDQKPCTECGKPAFAFTTDEDEKIYLCRDHFEQEYPADSFWFDLLDKFSKFENGF